jgi:hypothetical protein
MQENPIPKILARARALISVGASALGKELNVRVALRRTSYVCLGYWACRGSAQVIRGVKLAQYSTGNAAVREEMMVTHYYFPFSRSSIVRLSHTQNI